jgi:NLI interacting factor-like phosphatase
MNQLDNGVPIKAFIGDTNDCELNFILEFLEEIHGSSDIRVDLQRQFNLAYHIKNIRENHKNA